MSVACLAVIVIILAMSFIFLRSKRSNYALAILPLILVPAVHAGAGFVYEFFSRFWRIGFSLFIVSADLVALAVAFGIFGFMSAAIETRRARSGYLLMCGGFTLVFTIALLTDVLVH